MLAFLGECIADALAGQALTGSTSRTWSGSSSSRACSATRRVRAGRRRRASCRSSRALRGVVRHGAFRAGLQAGLDLGSLSVSGKIDRIDLDPFSARGIVQDYKSGKTAHSAVQIESEIRLQIPLYMLVLRDLLGVEPIGGLYRALAGERRARGLLRAEARDDGVPGFASRDYLDDDAFWSAIDGAADQARAIAGRIREGTSRTIPRAAFRALVVRARADVPGDPRMSTVVETTIPNPDQRAAIEAEGTVFVSAGAGTGKTRVLVERFVRAVEAGVDVESILVITFTDRSAGELRSRSAPGSSWPAILSSRASSTAPGSRPSTASA